MASEPVVSPTVVPAGQGAESTVPGPRLRNQFQRGSLRWVILALVVLLAFVMMIPFIIMLLNAFKSPAEYSANGPVSLPSHLYFDGLVNFWNRVDFPQKLVNSIWIAGAVAILATIVSLFNAYALGIGRIKGRLWIVGLFLLANMLPQESLIYPLYYVAKQVGLYNNQWSVIIIFTVIQSAFGTYLLASVFSMFPPSILEAAALDGATKWQILWRVVYPISRPTLSVLVIFFFIFQRTLTRGITAGAVK